MKRNLEVYEPIQLTAKNLTDEQARGLLEYIASIAKENNDTIVWVLDNGKAEEDFQLVGNKEN